MQQSQQNQQTQSQIPTIPLGLKALIDRCHSTYPDQPNPLQITTVLKYWLGGHDPLDYISLYNNRGNYELGILPHWHYVSFGLSDLHGDGRVHPRDESENGDVPLSGMGFELTFRLLKNPNDERPPTWPANLLQALARYCFQSGNRLCVGDNVPWRKPLDNSTTSLIQHLLITEDPQLGMINTPFGSVQFCQIVGVTESELEQASRWNGKGILNYLKRDVTTGGEFLVTNMFRTQSLFEIFPETLQQLQDDLEKEGSDLAGINAEFTFKELNQKKFKSEIDSDVLNEQCLLDENINRFPDTKEITLMDLSVTNESFSFLQSMSLSHSLEEACPIDFQPLDANVNRLDGIEITLAFSAAKYLLLAIKDRIRHGRHFTFKAQNLALTFIGETVTGSSVTKSSPYGVIGYWVQVLITDDFVPRLIEAFQTIDSTRELTERKEFDFPDKNFKIIIDNPIPYNTLKNSL